MGAVGSQSLYLRQVNLIMKKLREDLTLDSILRAVEDSALSDHLKELARIRLKFFLGAPLVVDQHDGDFHLGQHRHVKSADTRRHDDDSIDAALVERTHDADLALRIGPRISQNDRVAVFASDLVDSADDLVVERIRDLGDDDPDRLGLSRDQASRHRAGGVACFVRNFLDPRDRLRLNDGDALQRPRHGGVRYA
jgi:hypothetical protein